MVRAADLVNLPGIKKAPKKQIAAILEPSSNDIGENNEAAAAAAEEESDEENASDTEELGKFCFFVYSLFAWLSFLDHISFRCFELIFLLRRFRGLCCRREVAKGTSELEQER